MEWVLILTLATGSVALPRAYSSELECIGAGELTQPQCVRSLDLFNRAEEVCQPRRFICVPQPRPPATIIRRQARVR
jgi:hypothetical protein